MSAIAAQITITSDIVDMKGIDGVTFLVAINDMANTAVITAIAQGGIQANGSNAIDLAASATYTATGAATGDAKLITVEVFRPLQRYIRLKILRATADSSLDVIIALKSRPADAPVIQGANVLATSIALSP